jgi:actin-related protein 10
MTSPSGDDSLELDLPPTSDTGHSESEFSHVSGGRSSNISSQPDSSEFSTDSQPRVIGTEHHRGEGPLQALATMYTRHSTATELHLPVVPPVSQQTTLGRGTLIIPGWIRERAAEVLFEGGDVDESSVAEVILEALLKVKMIFTTFYVSF